MNDSCTAVGSGARTGQVALHQFIHSFIHSCMQRARVRSVEGESVLERKTEKREVMCVYACAGVHRSAMKQGDKERARRVCAGCARVRRCLLHSKSPPQRLFSPRGDTAHTCLQRSDEAVARGTDVLRRVVVPPAQREERVWDGCAESDRCTHNGEQQAGRQAGTFACSLARAIVRHGRNESRS